MTTTDVAQAIGPALERGDCEHTAILLQSVEALPAVLVSFYNLGASRNGWLVHGSLPGQGGLDRSRMINSGLDVERLERDGRMAVIELDLSVSPDEWVKPWSALLEQKLNSGFDAMWFSRFPIGAPTAELAGVLPFEAAWMRCFKGRRVVTLCPYIAGGMTSDVLTLRKDAVSAVHDQVLQPA